MAERPTFGQARRRPGLPALIGGVEGAGGGGSAAASAFGILARTLAGVSADAHQRYDRQVAVEADEAGVSDAIAGRVRRLDRSTTRGAAYHDAAVSTMGTIFETKAVVALSDLYRENANDPAALQEGVDLYSEGALGQLAEIDPGAAVRLRARIVTQAIPMVNGAIANREKAMADAVKASREASEQELEALVAASAELIFSDDPEASRAATAALLDAHSRTAELRAAEGAEAFLLSRLSSGHGSAHITNMQAPLKTRLAAMIEGAPEDVAAGLGIYSGYRSIERQRELWLASDRTGQRVAAPGRSQHNHGNAADISWNGMSLSDDRVPQSVRDWLYANAGDYGLQFPLKDDPKERHHIEVQESRGGEPFLGDVRFKRDPDAPGASRETLGGAADQEFYDAVIGTGFKAHFQRQTDKVRAYLDFIEGKTVLPMHMPDGSTVAVNVRERLSEPAMAAIEQDLRARMQFERGLIEDAERASAAAADKRSDETTAGFMTGVLFNGREMDVNGRKVKAVMPTPGQLLKALDDGDLNSSDYIALSKAITVDRPFQSDEDVLRAAYRAVDAGEDPRGHLMANLDRITVADAERLQGYHRARTDQAGELNATQTAYQGALEDSFAQGMFKFDEGKNERKVNAVLEYRERVLANEDPKKVFEDIAARSKLAEGLAMTPPVPRPRFSVPMAGSPNMLDGAASFAALQKALADRTLTGEEYDRNLRFLDEFIMWQDSQAPAAAVAP